MASMALSINQPTLRISSGSFCRVYSRVAALLRQLGAVAQGLPARFQRHPKDVFLGVVVAHLQLGGYVQMEIFGVIRRVHVVVVVGVVKLRPQLILPLLKGIGDVFEEYQPQYNVFVHGSVQVGAQLVGGSPELFSRSLKNSRSMGFKVCTLFLAG